MKRRTRAHNSRFEAEVLPCLPELEKAALRLKGNQMDAEDLVQETLLQALRFWDRFTPGTNCRAWLIRILNNQHIDEWRAASRRAFSVDIDCIAEADLACFAHAPTPVPSPEQVLMSKVLVDDMNSALFQLKGEFRTIVVMHLVRDLPYRRIAQITQLSLGTIKSRLYRGRQLLRRSLNEYANNNRYVTQNEH